jgi:sulfate transport system ATP-binding protein
MTFIGDTARIPARIEGGRVSVGARPVELALKNTAEGEVDLYCRPWHLRVVDVAGAPLAGAVRAIRRVGRARHVDVEVAPGTCVEVEVQAEVAVAPGQPVGIAIDSAYAFARKRDV